MFKQQKKLLIISFSTVFSEPPCTEYNKIHNGANTIAKARKLFRKHFYF